MIVMIGALLLAVYEDEKKKKNKHSSAVIKPTYVCFTRNVMYEK